MRRRRSWTPLAPLQPRPSLLGCQAGPAVATLSQNPANDPCCASLRDGWKTCLLYTTRAPSREGVSFVAVPAGSGGPWSALHSGAMIALSWGENAPIRPRRLGQRPHVFSQMSTAGPRHGAFVGHVPAPSGTSSCRAPPDVNEKSPERFAPGFRFRGGESDDLGEWRLLDRVVILSLERRGIPIYLPPWQS